MNKVKSVCVCVREREREREREKGYKGVQKQSKGIVKNENRGNEKDKGGDERVCQIASILERGSGRECT